MNFNFKQSKLVLMLASTLALTACGGGGDDGGDDGGGDGTTNTAPNISGSPILIVSENQDYSFTPTASDAQSTALSFTVSNEPDWAAFNTSTGALTGTPGYNDAGEYANISITVSDDALSSTLPSFTITVADVFSLAGNSIASVDEATPFTYSPTLTGAVEGDVFSLAEGYPAWLTINALTGELTGTPGADDSDEYTVTINATNGISQDTLAVTITVADTVVTVQTFEVTGKLIDGYITDANVFIDFNNNLIHDANEPNAITSSIEGEEGSFTLTVMAEDMAKLSKANLAAEIGSGEGVNARDIDRPVEHDFTAEPFILLGNTLVDLDTSTGTVESFITPFTHLIQEQVFAAIEDPSQVTDAVLKQTLDIAKVSVEEEHDVDIAIATSDFFADDVAESDQLALAVKATALLDVIQGDADSDGDGVKNSADDFPLDDRYNTDTDGDTIADAVDPDIDGDGLLNDDDPNSSVANTAEFFVPAPGANMPGTDICVGVLADDSLLCLADGVWTTATSLGGADIKLTANTIVKSTALATGSSTCALTNGKIYCFGGDIAEEFDLDLGSSDGSIAAINPTHLEVGSGHMCYLDDGGVHCYNGLSGNSDPIIVGKPVMSKVIDIAGTTDAMCAIASTSAPAEPVEPGGGSGALGDPDFPFGPDGIQGTQDDYICYDGNISNDPSYCAVATQGSFVVANTAAEPVAVTTANEANNIVSCWGGDAYGMVASINDATFNQPQDLFSVANNVCVQDADGLECFGSNDVGIGAVDFASTSISQVTLTTDALCILDDAGMHCFGGTSGEGSTIATTTTRDLYNPSDNTLMKAFEFEKDMSDPENIVNIAIELNPFNLEPELFVEGEHQQRKSFPLVEIPDTVINPSAFALDNPSACFIENGDVICNTVTRCFVSSATAGDAIPIDAAYWKCSVTDYDFVAEFEHDVTAIDGNDTVMCAFTVADAYCESNDGAGFKGFIAKP